MNDVGSNVCCTNEIHRNVIIHIDIDYFYAQVEEIRNPALRDKPMGVRQNTCVVTANSLARSYGVKKMIFLNEAMQLCPELVLVHGEDLTPYRQMSTKIHNILIGITPNVEKLGLDENFLDVTSIVDQRIADNNYDTKPTPLIDGNVYPENDTLNSCNCGCALRLTVGAQLAKEIRTKLYDELGITTCAGIAHNKLLAKIIGTKNKPNKQTVLIPSRTNDVMIGLGSVRSITGIGQKAEQQLNELGIETVQQLQNVDFSSLERIFGYEIAMKYRNWSYGIDKSLVIPSGKPKSISLEDSCRPLSFRADVEERFRVLLVRLLNQVSEDGRIPLVIKIIVRKFDSKKKTSHRETRQANISSTLFKGIANGKVQIADNGQEKILKIVMRLFERVVNLRQPFNITLLGLAFSKFQEKEKSTRSIANFLIRTDLEVQSITSISSDGVPAENYQARCSPAAQIDFDTLSEASHASYSSDISESEVEPSPKKNKFSLSLAKRRCFLSDVMDTASPSKLRVADLRLNSKELDNDVQMHSISSPISTPNNSIPNTPTASSPSSISMNDIEIPSVAQQPPITQPQQPQQQCSLNSDIPPIVDPNVFRELPYDVQQELINQWRSSSPREPEPTVTATVKTQKPNKKAKTNTLHRFFITNN